LKSKEPAFQSAAIEYMDNTLDRSLRRVILPAIDSIPEEEKLARVTSLLPVRKRTADEALLELLSGTDSWLSACAIYWIYQQRRKDLYPYVQTSLRSTDRLVQETLQWTLNQTDFIKASAGQPNA
jgi:hypothetical protein